MSAKDDRAWKTHALILVLLLIPLGVALSAPPRGQGALYALGKAMDVALWVLYAVVSTGVVAATGRTRARVAVIHFVGAVVLPGALMGASALSRLKLPDKHERIERAEGTRVTVVRWKLAADHRSAHVEGAADFTADCEASFSSCEWGTWCALESDGRITARVNRNVPFTLDLPMRIGGDRVPLEFNLKLQCVRDGESVALRRQFETAWESQSGYWSDSECDPMPRPSR